MVSECWNCRGYNELSDGRAHGAGAIDDASDRGDSLFIAFERLLLAEISAAGTLDHVVEPAQEEPDQEEHDEELICCHFEDL